MLEDGKCHQVMFLSIKGLFRARRDMFYYKCLYESSLILPSSKGIIRGVHFLRRNTAARYNPFDFIISLLSFAEKNGHSVYLLGAKKQDLEKAEQNVRTSFPALRVIGRHAGFFGPETERDVITAIQKSSPAFLLVGRGVKGRELWIYRHRQDFQKGIAIWIDNCFEIFAGRHTYVSEKLFQVGLESFDGLLRHPLRVFRFFRYMYYNLLLLIYKIFKL
jgi:N-acetylglucosaminyldiphosphoundecaprenol N-acetyl-beta-D-mannosaminyltransferase